MNAASRLFYVLAILLAIRSNGLDAKVSTGVWLVAMTIAFFGFVMEHMQP